MLTRLLSSPTAMTWLNLSVKFGSGVIVLPIVILYLSSVEVSLWIFLSSIVALGMLADFGIGVTSTRAVSYFYAGKTDLLSHEEPSGQINFSGLATLFPTLNSCYLGLLVFALLLLLLGAFLAENLVSAMPRPEHGWVSYGLIVLSCLFRLWAARDVAFLSGVGLLHRVRLIESIIQIVKIFAISLGVMLAQSILFVCAVEALLTLFLLVVMCYERKKWFSESESKPSRLFKIDYDVMRFLWPSGWRSSGIQWGTYLINNSVVLLVAQADDVSDVTGVLVCLKVAIFIRTIAQAPLYAHIPRMTQLFVRGEFSQLRLEFALKMLFQILLFSAGYLSFVVLVLGADYLELVNWSLPSSLILALLFIWLFLEAHHSAHAQMYMISNHVPFFLPALISGLAIVVFGYLLLPEYGLVGVLLSQIIVQALFNNWYPVYKNLSQLNWSFYAYVRGTIWEAWGPLITKFVLMHR